MGNCMATKRGDNDHVSKVTPFKRDGSFSHRIPILGSGHGFQELENSVTIHKQHTAKQRASRVIEAGQVVVLNDESWRKESEAANINNAGGPH